MTLFPRFPFLRAGFAGAALAAAAVPAAAQSSVTIYGRLNAALESVDASRSATDLSTTRLSNYRSVLGFRGDEDLGGGLKAIFQIEGALSLDTGTGGVANRDTRLGLAGRFGTLFAGHWTLPYTAATAGFDPFYPTTAGYMALMGNGSAPTTDHLVDTSAFDRRQRNVVQYWTPTVSGFSARLAYSPNEGVSGAGGGKPSLWSAAAGYEAGQLALVVAHEAHRNYQGPDTTDTATKLGAAYRVGPVRVAGVVERLLYETPTGDLKRNSAYVSAVWQATANGSVRVGIARADDGKGPSTDTVGFFRSGAETGATQYTVGYEHALSRRTAVFAFYSRIDNEAAAIYDFAINELGVGAGVRPSVVALGLRHFF